MLTTFGEQNTKEVTQYVAPTPLFARNATGDIKENEAVRKLEGNWYLLVITERSSW